MGSYCAIGSVKGQLLPVPTLKGKLSIPSHSICEHQEFDGEYTVTPGDTQIILETAGKLLTQNIVVEPSSGVMPPGSSMATDGDIDDLINEIFRRESDMPKPDDPTYNEEDIATDEELDDVLKDVFG